MALHGFGCNSEERKLKIYTIFLTAEGMMVFDRPRCLIHRECDCARRSTTDRKTGRPAKRLSRRRTVSGFMGFRSRFHPQIQCPLRVLLHPIPDDSLHRSSSVDGGGRGRGWRSAAT